MTLIVMLESVRLALTTTPSMLPSSAEATCPVSCALACGEARTSAKAAVEMPDNHRAIIGESSLLGAFDPLTRGREPRAAAPSVQGHVSLSPWNPRPRPYVTGRNGAIHVRQDTCDGADRVPRRRQDYATQPHSVRAAWAEVRCDRQ